MTGLAILFWEIAVVFFWEITTGIFRFDFTAGLGVCAKQNETIAQQVNKKLVLFITLVQFIEIIRSIHVKLKF